MNIIWFSFFTATNNTAMKLNLSDKTKSKIHTAAKTVCFRR